MKVNEEGSKNLTATITSPARATGYDSISDKTTELLLRAYSEL